MLNSQDENHLLINFLKIRHIRHAHQDKNVISGLVFLIEGLHINILTKLTFVSS